MKPLSLCVCVRATDCMHCIPSYLSGIGIGIFMHLHCYILYTYIIYNIIISIASHYIIFILYWIFCICYLQLTTYLFAYVHHPHIIIIIFMLMFMRVFNVTMNYVLFICIVIFNALFLCFLFVCVQYNTYFYLPRSLFTFTRSFIQFAPKFQYTPIQNTDTITRLHLHRTSLTNGQCSRSRCSFEH